MEGIAAHLVGKEAAEWLQRQSVLAHLFGHLQVEHS